ncbi:protein translocase SEC61 complex subunit gamma [Candidatus Woesearchaeota archaeon]|nr:protein translocase SEC61 complex subunit gamma [Candidatus Woesearchaeota archaeon]
MEETTPHSDTQTQNHSQEQTASEDQQPSKLKRFIKESLRVLHVTKKPNKEEYLSIVKVSGLGIGILGALGFIIFLIDQLLFK